MRDGVQWLPAGCYVVAVSGGCDSMVLLDVLARAAAERGYELVVAHFDHAMRPDSGEDEALVRRVAAAQGLRYVTARATQPLASEAAARAARYDFLITAQRQAGVVAVVTAHHQDDVLETSLLNLARGTGRRGLAPMQTGPVQRPLLAVSRGWLREYATTHGLEWREDATNQDRANPRNLLRHELLPAADEAWRKRYLAIIEQLAALNQDIEAALAGLGRAGSFSRELARDLSLAELAELVRWQIQQRQPGLELDERLLAELALFAKTGRPGRQRPVRGRLKLRIGRENVEFC